VEWGLCFDSCEKVLVRNFKAIPSPPSAEFRTIVFLSSGPAYTPPLVPPIFYPPWIIDPNRVPFRTVPDENRSYTSSDFEDIGRARLLEFWERVTARWAHPISNCRPTYCNQLLKHLSQYFLNITTIRLICMTSEHDVLDR
jgi:hypothetical protein